MPTASPTNGRQRFEWRATDAPIPILQLHPKWLTASAPLASWYVILATSTLQREEHDIKVNLPADSAQGSLSSVSRTLVINVRKDGTYYLQNGIKTLDEMRRTVSDAAAHNAEQKVLIRGDREALHGHVAAAVSACRNSGIHEANIGYQLPR